MKGLRIAGAAAVVAAALAGTSSAVIRAERAEPPLVTTGRAPRTHRDVAWARPSTLAGAGLVGWSAIVDRDTDVPLRMWGANQVTAGSVADPAVAERIARDFVATHLAVLAPGAQPADFVVVANQLDPSGELRSVGFAQRARGIAVIGGTIGIVFKRDRIVLVGSTALPHVAVAVAPVRLAEGRVTAAAVAWLGRDGYQVAPHGAVASERVIVPIVHPRGTRGIDIEYTLADQVTVESTTIDPGRWTVFVDAATGSAFARQSQLMYASGTVLFDVPVRAPAAAAGRHSVGAANDTHSVNGASATSDAAGAVTWTGTTAATVLPGLGGPFVQITNKSGALVAGSLTLPAAGTVTWTQAATEKNDSQLAAFVYANEAKAFVKAKLNPTLAYLAQTLSVTVNEPLTCNAYSTGDDVHFFSADATCENTGRIADVVYHEFGHSMHNASIIPGVGQFNGALSEGIADTLAVAMTGDPGVGRGFHYSDAPLRDLNPVVKKRWPQDTTGEVHNDGEIYGEAMWDLRAGLQAALGDTAGYAQFLKLYYGTVQRASDIPSSYPEVLAADDDDGDLTNGTPNFCTINAAFGAHGLADLDIALGIAAPVRDNYTISIATTGRTPACPGAPTIQNVTVDWRRRGGTLAQIALTGTGATYTGEIQAQPDDTVVEYKVTVTLSDGSMVVYPNNKADPLYQFYVGPVTTIWCADFESGLGDWTHAATPASKDEWQVGAPQGFGGDPETAHGGTNVLGIDLSIDGVYPDRITSTAATSPVIDLAGHTQNVHLQYWRWLGVEDGFFDKATISANGAPVWSNFASVSRPATEVNHIDREWRFQDIDVSAQAATGSVQLAFALESDPGFEAGGWTLDDVCLVAGGATCGNGQLDPGEACDDGNTAAGDGCSATCELEKTASGGCCDAGTSPAAPLGLSALALGLVLRRRRSRRDAPAPGLLHDIR